MQTLMNVLLTVSKCVPERLALNVIRVLVSMAIDLLMMTALAMVYNQSLPIALVQESASLIILLIDINECSEASDGCAQNCTNTNGSYTCSCNTGYRLDNDRHSCNGT